MYYHPWFGNYCHSHCVALIHTWIYENVAISFRFSGLSLSPLTMCKFIMGSIYVSKWTAERVLLSLGSTSELYMLLQSKSEYSGSGNDSLSLVQLGALLIQLAWLIGAALRSIDA
jgi:hypothetical protein